MIQLHWRQNHKITTQESEQTPEKRVKTNHFTGRGGSGGSGHTENRSNWHVVPRQIPTV
jgi:hypothetical protein